MGLGGTDFLVSVYDAHKSWSLSHEYIFLQFS